MKRIHIIGTQRAGTTLMKNLFVCYKDVYIAGGEPLWDQEDLFMQENKDTHHIVSKNPGEDADGGLLEAIDNDPNLKVICMVRDPRDILCSIWGDNDAPMWMQGGNWLSLGSRLDFITRFRIQKGSKVCFVKYEELVTEPEKIQKEIAEFTGLEIEISFSDWETRRDESTAADTDEKAMRGFRPPDTNSIGKGKSVGHIQALARLDPRLKLFLRYWYGVEV